MTWLDIGNGWRNLYLLSCMLTAFALGVLFCMHRLFAKRSRVACFLTGVAVTPFVQYLWTLLLSILWPAAPKWVYIGVLPAASFVYLAVLALCNLRRASALLKAGWAFVRRVCRFDKPALACLCFALCIVILIAPVCVRFMSSMNSLELSGDGGEYMALAQRYCSDRNLWNLLEKEELEGRFRGHNHFPSLELFMSYGLFHTGGEIGYPFDKPAVTGIGMLTFYAIAAYGALLFILCREKKPYILLGVVLLNIIPNLYDSVAGAPRDIWRILALLLGVLYFAGLSAKEPGFWRNAGKTAATLLACFVVMSAHVVCFVQLPFIVVAWVVWQWITSLYAAKGGAGKVLVRSICMAVGGAVGTLIAFAGNLWCYMRWGQLSPWRLTTTFTDAPWYQGYLLQDYRIEETTTQLNFFEDVDGILYAHASPLGPWGFRIALLVLVSVLAALVVRRIRLRKQVQAVKAQQPNDGPTAVLLRTNEDSNRLVECLLYAALVPLMTLAPMTGILDTGYYSFSGTFASMPRYTLQWFLLAAVLVCAALAAFDDLWPKLLSWLSSKLEKCKQMTQSAALRAVPAWLCVVLCLMGVVQGTKQTGYADSFYRTSRHVMESESMLLDNGFQEKFGLLMHLAENVQEDEMILIPRSGYQYPLKAKGHVLDANPIVPVMNLSLEEVPGELARMNVVMLATESTFWDNRYYPLSTLAEYLEALPEEQKVEYGGMRYYLVKPELAQIAHQWMNDHPTVEE